ncbi:NADH dehydrogenase [bacterium]|nr:NADH dehydrogenase [bacterium]
MALLSVLYIVCSVSICLASDHYHDTQDYELSGHRDVYTVAIGAINDGAGHAGHYASGEDIPFDQITPEGSHRSSLPLWLIMIPLLGGIMLAFFTDDCLSSNLLVLLTGMTFAISVFLYQPVIKGIHLDGAFMKGVYFEFPFLPQFGINLTFKVDPVSMTLVIFTCLIWFLTSIFSKSYLEAENKRQRYNIANCCCLAVTLGAFMAGDFFTLYIFYEAILLFLYLMVIHREDEAAIAASKVYLYLGIATGLILLYGIFLLYHVTGTVEIKSLGMALASAPSWARYAIAGMMIAGFGGKAGVFLEHIWMPCSYGDSPALTAALSSGIMIEVGAYGILRTVNMIFAPLGSPADSQLWSRMTSSMWMETSHVGHVLIWLGIMTMFFGAMNALISNHSLKLLAYSSVSQMGYIIMGIGCAAYMGTQGAMGLTASTFHIINHALFKAALFLCVGAVFFRTRETDIRKLGGLWRNMPVTAFVMLVSMCAISGIPGFNGFASKTMLHHAIIEAYEHSVHILGSPDRWLRLAEVMFIVTAGCTFAYNMKLFYFIFLGKRPHKYAEITPAPSPMKVPLSILATLAVFIGIFPNWFLNHFLGPMLSYFGFDSGSHAYHIIYDLHAHGGPRSTISLLYNPVTKAFFSDPEVVHNLVSGSSAIMIGGVVVILGITFGCFLYKLPKRYHVEIYYRKLFSGFLALCALVYKGIVYAAELTVAKLMVYAWMTPLKMEHVISPRIIRPGFEEKEIWDYISAAEDKVERVKPGQKGIFDHISYIDKKYDKAIDRPINDRSLYRQISKVDERLSKSVDNAMLNKGIFTSISKVDERLSGSVDKAITRKNMFDKVTSADGIFDGLVDKVIFSRIFWGMITRKDAGALTSDLLKKFTTMEKRYDSLVEKALFGLIGSEDLSKIKLKQRDFSRSWFLNICKKAAKIHTGDVSNYVSWIAVALTVIIVILVGIPYLQTPFAVILAVTLTIFVTSILALIFL